MLISASDHIITQTLAFQFAMSLIAEETLVSEAMVLDMTAYLLEGWVELLDSSEFDILFGIFA